MEIVTASASHHAMLFAYITRETIAVLGATGKSAIAEAVRKCGVQRGRRMAMRADMDGIERNALSYMLYSEWSCYPGQVEITGEVRNKRYYIQYHRCPWFTEWKCSGMQEFGHYYCSHIDAALLEGFGAPSGHLNSTRVEGASLCELVFDDLSLHPAEQERFRELSIVLGDAARMPWEYHIGNLYQSMRNSLCAQAGEMGNKVLRDTMKSYTKQFGKHAGEMVLENADADYDALPPYSAPLCEYLKTNRIGF